MLILVPIILLAAPSPWHVLPKVQACDSTMWTLSSQAFIVDILTVNTDKPSYRPGDPVVIFGTVRLVEQDSYYQSDCNPQYQATNPFADDPQSVELTLTSSYAQGALGSTSASADGGFSFTIAIDKSAASGTYPFTITAGCSQCVSLGQTQGASQDGSFVVQAYTPTFTITPATVFPGDKLTITGDGWAPNDPIQVAGFAAGAVGPTFSFEAAPDITEEGAHSVTATQGTITLTAHYTVKWHTLSITLTNPPTQLSEGGTVYFKGVVTCDDCKEPGQPVSGIPITDNIVNPRSGKTDSSSLTSDSNGMFSFPVTIPCSFEECYTPTFTNELSFFASVGSSALPYHSGTAHATLSIVAQPILVPAAVAAAGALTAIATAIGLNKRRKK